MPNDIKKPPVRKPERQPEDDLPDDWGRPFPFRRDDSGKLPANPFGDGMGLPGYIPAHQQTPAYMAAR